EGTHQAYLRPRDGALIAFAGLYEQRMAGDDALSYAIVACIGKGDTPYEPLVLAPEHYDAWLNHEDPRHLLMQRAAHLVEVEASHARVPHIAELALAPAADSAAAHNARA
ncbi:MAG TPA: hypothetical protein VNT02_05070, partial [Burkholderiales bacterium]|nr:hypothetical protein [Burkholderiales bacterium]